MPELKPGYWRRRDGAMALVIGPNPHAKDPTDGWVGASVSVGMACSWDINGITEPGEELQSDLDLVEYIGPTLPPEPPTPPEGWELLPDGTAGNPEYMRLWQRLTGGDLQVWEKATQLDRCEQRLAGEVINGCRLWYARRIEPEPVWTPTDEYRGYAVIEGLDGNCVRVYCRVEEVERKHVRGDDFKWEDV